jgi:SAM-dependent methyltransferase
MTKEYNPREYWPDRLKREGKLYVSTKNNPSVYQSQGEVFWETLSDFFPDDDIDGIIDFGCGVGRFAERVAARVGYYIGVDINEGAFRYAPEIENGEFVFLPEDRIPFDDATFDGAMSVTVLQHIVDPSHFETWTSEISRVVKPGGFFLIIDDANPKTKMGMHMKVRGPEVIAEALGASVEYQEIIDAERPKSHYCFRARKV